MTSRDERLEDLLAEALAKHDEGGQQALDAFVAANAADAAALQRGLARCRQMGLLGGEPVRRDFPERLGEFRLIRRLGSGGMGVVYEAEQESLGRRVALKVVRPELLYFEGARERFRREIEAVARLQHPAVVPVLASGDQDGVPWYAMELLTGRTVHGLCETLAGRDPAELRGVDLRQALGATAESGTDPLEGAWWQICARIVHTVALGVRHAHLRGIVHRDIKPANVMLTQDGRVVLLDFGVAMLAGPGRDFTRTGHTPGSPAFMSPEQLRGNAVDERTDVYSLGATLWQMLTLVAPFRGDADLQRIRDGDVPSLLVHNREVPTELVIVVQKAMDRDRERRYHDVEAFAEDLTAVLHRRPIRARRTGLRLRAWRWCQRHRVTATALASLLAIALVLPAVFAWRERAVNEELAAAAAQTRHNLATTLDTIRELLVLVGDDKLRHVPGAGDVAGEALQQACARYRELLARPGDDARLRTDAGQAFSRYGDLLLRSGANDAGVATLREGIRILRGDELDVPREWLQTRAVLGVNLGSAELHLGRREAGERALGAAARDLDAIGDDPKFALQRLRTRVELASQRAGVHDPSRDAEAMERDVRVAVALARELCGLRPDNGLDRRQLVEQLDMLATFLCKRGRHDEAMPLLDEALALARSIPADTRCWPPPPMVVAAVLETLGNLHRTRRDHRAAAALKECVELRERMVSAHPQDVHMRCELAAALHNLAEMSFAQENDDLAFERVERAITLQRSVLAQMPTFVRGREYLRNHLRLLGSLLAAAGRAADLHTTACELAAMQDDTTALRAAARQWLRLGKLVDAAPDGAPVLPSPAACDDRAMELLLRAERIGWGNGSAFGDAVYDRVRSRADFQALQQRISARAKPAGG